jgi:hypothetical protein
MTVGEACAKYEGMPPSEEIFLAIHNDPSFKMRYEKALETWAYASMDKLTEEADNSAKDFIMVKGVRVPNREAIQRSKLRTDVRAKLIEYANPKRFKDREVNFNALPLAGMSEEEAATKLVSLIQAVQQRMLRQREAQTGEPATADDMVDVTPTTGIPSSEVVEVVYSKKQPDPDPAQPVATIAGRHGRGSVVYELLAESPDHDHPALA